MGYVQLGFVCYIDFLRGKPETIEKGIELAQKALAMDDSIGLAHGLLGDLYTCKREYDKAIAEGERGVALNPGGMTVLHSYGRCLTYAGRPEEAIPVFQKAIRVSPSVWYSYNYFALALRMTGRFEEAVSQYKKAIQLSPDSIGPHVGLAVTYILMGSEKGARAEAAEVLRINPKFSVDRWKKIIGAVFKDQSETDKVVDALRKAGLK